MELTSSFIRTKLNTPRINGDLVGRPHLFELNQRLNRKATLIAIPAGSGRTSLVVSSASRIPTEPAPCVDSITTNDQQPAIFCAGQIGFGKGDTALLNSAFQH